MTSDAPTPTTVEADPLARARNGDRRAFDQVVAPHRRELLAHCYRMLGSIHDADDALQDTLLRAWRGLPRFDGRSSLRTWLFKIATNACLALAQRKSRHPVGADPHWLEPYPDQHEGRSPADVVEQRENMEIAFVAAVQHLPSKERAVLLLRDALRFSAQETAEVLGISVPAVTSRLQRARVKVRNRIPEASQRDTLRRIGDKRLRELVTAYVDAWEAGDANAIVALVTDDAEFSMPPQATLIEGRSAIELFLRDSPLQNRWRLVPTRAAGQLAFGCYIPEGSTWVAHSVDVLTLRADRISRITAFIDPTLPRLLGLPDRLPSTP